jgi:hypothetical protein
MIPFLKKKEAAMSGPVEVMEREPDEGKEESFEMLDAICQDMMDAFHKKDHKLLKSALEALVEHIQDVDASQDLEQP